MTAGHLLVRLLAALLAFLVSFVILFQAAVIVTGVRQDLGAAQPAYVWLGLLCLVPSLLAVRRLDQHCRRFDLPRKLAVVVFLALVSQIVPTVVTVTH